VWARDYGAARRDGWSDADLRAQLADHGLADTVFLQRDLEGREEMARL